MDLNSLHHLPYKKLTEWLKSKRLEQGLSLRDLGAKADIHHSVIGLIETQGRNLSITEYWELCQLLEADPLEGMAIVEKELASSPLAKARKDK